MAGDPEQLFDKMVDHYAPKWAEHGATPRGVDWNGEQSQLVHFEQLLRIVGEPHGFSLNDLGCGYGALLAYLRARHADFRYRGYDINADMIASAQRQFADVGAARFAVASAPTEPADYGVASGIFTLRLERSDAQCRQQLQDTLDALDATSRLGFAFNCLTSYSDPDRMRDYLYYPDPCDLFDLCKRRYSRQVALLHDYGLYAFTILVRKPS